MCVADLVTELWRIRDELIELRRSGWDLDRPLRRDTVILLRRADARPPRGGERRPAWPVSRGTIWQNLAYQFEGIGDAVTLVDELAFTAGRLQDLAARGYDRVKVDADEEPIVVIERSWIAADTFEEHARRHPLDRSQQIRDWLRRLDGTAARHGRFAVAQFRAFDGDVWLPIRGPECKQLLGNPDVIAEVVRAPSREALRHLGPATRVLEVVAGQGVIARASVPALMVTTPAEVRAMLEQIFAWEHELPASPRWL